MFSCIFNTFYIQVYSKDTVIGLQPSLKSNGGQLKFSRLYFGGTSILLAMHEKLLGKQLAVRGKNIEKIALYALLVIMFVNKVFFARYTR